MVYEYVLHSWSLIMYIILYSDFFLAVLGVELRALGVLPFEELYQALTFFFT
jgi:hypothetical protein